MAFGATFTAILIRDFQFPLIVAMLIAMVVSMAMGCFTGILVAYAKMQGFVASLEMMTIARGIAFVIMNGYRQCDNWKRTGAGCDYSLYYWRSQLVRRKRFCS